MTPLSGRAWFPNGLALTIPPATLSLAGLPELSHCFTRVSLWTHRTWEQAGLLEEQEVCESALATSYMGAGRGSWASIEAVQATEESSQSQ